MAGENETAAGTQTNSEGSGEEQGQEQKQSGAGEQDKSLMSRTAQEGDKKPEGEGKPDEKKPGEGDKDKNKDDPALKVPDKPDGYALQFAPETKVDAELLTGFQKTAHELGLTQGQAQKLGTLYEGHMKTAAERFVAEQTAFMLAARKDWEAEIAKSSTYEADLGRIQSAMKEFGDQELYDLLDQTNLGSHPKMWAFMAKIGKALAEPGLHGERAGAEKSTAKTLYPDMV